MASIIQATIGGKFAALIGPRDEDIDFNIMITTYSTAVTDAASGILGKDRRRKKPWVNRDLLALCDEAEGANNIQGSKEEDSEGSKEIK